jgi:hypothetical protein
MTRREVVVRDDGDERVYVEWFVGQERQSFTRITTDDGATDEIVMAADVNELGQLADALRDAQARLGDSGAADGTTMVRDLGAVERVYVETDGDYGTLAVEQVGKLDRMVVFDAEEAGTLAAAVERAKAELPSIEEGPHV